MTPLLAVGLSKSFGTKRVLESVDLAVERGQIHALLGPNGSGKSTLIGCLSGALVPDAGSIRIGDVEQPFFTPQAAIAAGSAVIYQNFSLVTNLSVADNVFLGDEIVRGGRVDHAAQRAATEELLSTFGRPIRSGPASQHAQRGRPPARGDRQGAPPEAARAHPRRAHGSPRRAGGERAGAASPTAARRRPGHPLRDAHPARGLQHRRPRHRPAGWQGRAPGSRQRARSATRHRGHLAGHGPSRGGHRARCHRRRGGAPRRRWATRGRCRTHRPGG